MPDNKRSFIAFLNKVRLSVMLRGKKIENAKLEKLSKKYTFVNYRVCEDLVSVAVGSEYFHVDLEDTPAYAERFDDGLPLACAPAICIRRGRGRYSA